jgi:hypothetical protein
MNVIETNEAAKIVAEDIRNFVLTNENLKSRCKGECSIVVGLEPLCREACKQLKTDKLSLALGEARIKFPTSDGVCIDYSRKAFSGLYTCVLNSHTSKVKSSYVPGGSPNSMANKRGCLGFDITKMRRFFKKEKEWARYYVAVQIGGVSDVENESFARRGAVLLHRTVEKMKLEPVNRPIEKAKIREASHRDNRDVSIPAVEVVFV